MAIRNLRTLQRRKEKKRLGFLIVPPLIAVVLCLAVFFLVRHFIRVEAIVFTGNHHLKNEELSGICGIKRNSGLFDLSGRDIYLRLRQSPWIKDAVVRKELSGRVLIKVTERVPVALLSVNDRPFLIDDEGLQLEEMKKGTILLLPVIEGIDPVADSETYADAVKFVTVLRDKKVVTYEGKAEITGRRPEDITLKIDNVVIKVGEGDYEKKLSRLALVRDEIQKRNINVEYIDLRFADKIIVKPVPQDAGNSQAVAGG